MNNAALPGQIFGTHGEYRVVRFRAAHAHRIRERGLDVTDAAEVRGRHVGFTIMRGHEVVACVGFRHVWPGVCEGWALTSPLVHGCPALFTDLARRGCQWLFRHGYHRIGASALLSFGPARRWLERHLGFEFEGPAWAAGPHGEDYARYSLTRRCA